MYICNTVGRGCHLCFNYMWLHIQPSTRIAPYSFMRGHAAYHSTFVTKEIDETSVVSKVCQSKIAQGRNTSLFGFIFLWNDLIMVIFHSQAPMITMTVLGQRSKSTVPMCCQLLFFLFHLESLFYSCPPGTSFLLLFSQCWSPFSSRCFLPLCQL